MSRQIGGFRFSVSRLPSRQSEVIGACLLFHNDCDAILGETMKSCLVWTGGRAAFGSSVLGAFCVDYAGNAGSVGLGACLVSHMIVTTFRE